MMMNQNGNNDNNLAQPVARDYNYYSSNHSSLNNLSDLNSSTYNTNSNQQQQQNGGGNSSQTTTTVVADPWIVRRRTDGQRQFLYFYENQLQQQNNSKRRNQTQQQQQQRNNNTLHAPVMNVRTSHQDLVSLSDSLPITLKPSESYTFCFECHGWDFVQQRLMLAQNKNNNNTEQNITSRNASDVFAHSMISLFIARSTVAGRPVLLNHPVKV